MILHPIIDLLKRIVIALPDYAGGGGELPEGMNHTGSGEILFASRTTTNTPIDPGLSFTPRAVIIWTNVEPPSPSDMCYCVLTRQLAINSGTTKTARHLAVKTASESGLDITSYPDANADFFITNTTFNVGHGARYYAAGATYYWFAFD